MNKSILIAALMSMSFGMYAMHTEGTIILNNASNKKTNQIAPGTFNKAVPAIVAFGAVVHIIYNIPSSPTIGKSKL